MINNLCESKVTHTHKKKKKKEEKEEKLNEREK